jgi:hypothetical protein
VVLNRGNHFPKQNWLKIEPGKSFAAVCRSRIVADETRDGIVVAGGHENKIPFVENKQHTQITPDATFVKFAKRPDAHAGM